MQHRRVALVAQFMHRLMRDDVVEGAESVHPGQFPEVALDKPDTGLQIPQTLGRQRMHRRGEVERGVTDLRQGREQVVSQEAGPGAQFQHLLGFPFIQHSREFREEFGAPGAFQQGLVRPFAGVFHAGQINRAGHILEQHVSAGSSG